MVLALGVADRALASALSHAAQRAQHAQHDGRSSWADDATQAGVGRAAWVGVGVCLVLGVHQVGVNVCVYVCVCVCVCVCAWSWVCSKWV